jgi:hypothetical protein
MKRFLKALSLSLLLAGSISIAQAQTTVTFDGLSPGNDSLPVPSGYGNLQWHNFAAFNGANRPVTEGYRAGMISPNNVAYNMFGSPASIQGVSTFDLTSAYLTAAFQPGLQLRVQGFIGATLAYDHTYTLNPTAPVFAEFNYAGVDRVSFTAFPESQFVIDNLTVAPVLTNESCTFAISPTDRVYRSGSETGAVSVTTSSGCTWTVLNNNSWIIILSSLTNTGNATVLYQVQTNATSLPRSGLINMAGQTFAISQSPFQPTNAAPVNVGNIQVSALGHASRPPPFGHGSFPHLVADYLIDQNQSTGGGSVLQPVTVDWNTNSQFTLTVSAPPGMKFVVRVPDGQSAKFGGFLWWQSTGGGVGPPGDVVVTFNGLEGTPPSFSESTAVLADSHGYFGFFDIDSTPFTSDLAFSAIVITGKPGPQYAASGALNFTPHYESSLQLVCTTSGTNDPGPFVSIVSQVGPLRIAPPPEAHVAIDKNGDFTIAFNGTLQSSADPSGPFEDVVGNPLGVHVIPKASQTSQQFFRTRSY